MKATFSCAAVLAIAACGPTLFADSGAKPTSDDVQDFVYLGDNRPVLVRLHVQIDGKLLHAAWRGFVRHVFNECDTDHDGVLSKEEAERVPPPSVLLNSGFAGGKPLSMNALDANRDGQVTPDELEKYYRANGGGPFFLRSGQTAAQIAPRRIAIGGDAQSGAAEALNEALFARLDSNKDGRLSREELLAAPQVLLALDSDEDETVSVEELAPNAAGQGPGKGVFVLGPGTAKSPAPANFVPVTGGADRNLARLLQQRYGPKGRKAGNAIMTRQHMGLDEETFGRLDVDGDGSLDAEELARFAARPPDVELTLRLGARGERKAVEISDGDRPLSSHLRAEKDGATLDLDTTRIDFRTASGEEVMRSPLTSRQLYKGQFTNADQDGNGYLDKAEADRSPLFRDAFRLMDRDGDGKVFEKEMLAYLDRVEGMQKKAANACVSLNVADQGRGLFDLLDTNKDRKLGVRELRQAVKALKELDRDGDGFIARGELPHNYQLTLRRGSGGSNDFPGVVIVGRAQSLGGTFAAKADGPVWFRKMDRNRDGDVSRGEFLGTDEEFRAIDMDGDGLISVAEAKAADARLRKANESRTSDEATSSPEAP